jgi:alkaline phosphatase D
LTDTKLNGAVLNYDQWDGYEPARERLLESARAADRTIVLTGDIHLGGVGQLPGVGIEFVSTSISSTGLVPPDLEAVVATLGDIVDVELQHRGYTRHVVTPDTWTAEYRIVDDVADPGSPVSTWKTFVVSADQRDVVTPV